MHLEQEEPRATEQRPTGQNSKSGQVVAAMNNGERRLSLGQPTSQHQSHVSQRAPYGQQPTNLLGLAIACRNGCHLEPRRHAIYVEQVCFSSRLVELKL